MDKDYYEILGVERYADFKTIKSAYRVLVKKYHPDINKEEGAEMRFAEISKAYEVLSNEEKRAQYDKYGHEGYERSQEYGYNPGGQQYYGGFTQEDYERFYRQYNQANGGFEGYVSTSFSDLFKLWWNSFLRKSFSDKLLFIFKFIIVVIILIFVIRIFFRWVFPVIVFFIIVSLLSKLLAALFR